MQSLRSDNKKSFISAKADPEFWKGGPGKRAKPRTERRRRERRRWVWGASPENFEKLDAISCNLAYIFGIRMASDIIWNWAFAEQKTVAATISIHIHTHTPPTLPKAPLISATIKSKFNFKNIFSDMVYNVENKIDFAKNRGGGRPPWIRHWSAKFAHENYLWSLKLTLSPEAFRSLSLRPNHGLLHSNPSPSPKNVDSSSTRWHCRTRVPPHQWFDTSVRLYLM